MTETDITFYKDNLDKLDQEVLLGLPNFLNNFFTNIRDCEQLGELGKAIKQSMQDIDFDLSTFERMLGIKGELDWALCEAINSRDSKEEDIDKIYADLKPVENNIKKMCLPVYKAMRSAGYSHYDLVR